MFNIILILRFFFSFQNDHPKPEIYLIPENFRGKINIIFNQTNGADVKFEDDCRIYEIPGNGILLTKFKDEYGETNHIFYFVDSLGRRKQIEIIRDENIVSNDTLIGIFRDGTVGVYGDSNNPQSLSYQEFYVTDKKRFENYFLQEYQTQFEKEIIKVIGYEF